MRGSASWRAARIDFSRGGIGVHRAALRATRGARIAALILSATLTSCSAKTATLGGSGTIEAREIKVASITQGRILELPVEEGNEIRKGDLLAIIDSESYRLQAGAAKAGVDLAAAQLELLKRGARKEDLAQAEAALDSAQQTLTLAKSDAERMGELEKSGTVTRKQREDADARLSSASAARETAAQALRKLKDLARPEEIKAAEARLDQAEWSQRLADKAVSDCRIGAPSSGTITALLAESGEFVGPGSGIALLADLSKLTLKIYLSEAQAGRVKVGQSASVTVDAYPDKRFKGRVSSIASEAEFTPKNVQTKDERTKLVFAVKLDLGDGQGLLKPGMPADAVLGN